MDMLDEVDRFFVSGTTVTFTLDKKAKLDEKRIKTAVEKNKLGFVSIEKREAKKAKAAWVLNTPGLT